MNELHSGHIWVNAPFTLLPEVVHHYLQCKQAAPSTTACIVVPGFLLPVMRPFLKGMHILKTYGKGSTLFDAPTASGKRRAMAGTHWPVHVFTDALMPTHIPPVAGQQCHPLHKAIVHRPSAVPSVPAPTASAHCDAPASAAAPDNAFTLTQQLDGIKSQFRTIWTAS